MTCPKCILIYKINHDAGKTLVSLAAAGRPSIAWSLLDCFRIIAVLEDHNQRSRSLPLQILQSLPDCRARFFFRNWPPPVHPCQQGPATSTKILGDYDEINGFLETKKDDRRSLTWSLIVILVVHDLNVAYAISRQQILTVNAPPPGHDGLHVSEIR